MEEKSPSTVRLVETVEETEWSWNSMFAQAMQASRR